jgi:hypothetical protein
MRRSLFSLALLSTFLPLACGGNDTSERPVTLEGLPAALASTYCRVLETCLGSFLEVVPQPNCSRNLEQQFTNRTFVAINAAVQRGAVAYDAIKAGACLQAVEAQGCDLFASRNPPICDEALSGDVALGGPCSIDAECSGDAHCDLGGGTCPGVCAERRGDGEMCTESDDCQSGLTCQSSVCRAPAGPGETCGGPSGPECRLGLTCVGEDTTTTAGTCGEFAVLLSGKAGEACNPSAEPRKLCETSLSCVLDPITLAGMTFSCQPKSGSGAACRLGFPEPCPSGEYCKVANPLIGDGTCTRMPQSGESCLTETFRLSDCALDLVCVNGTCAGRKGNGAACNSALECYSDLCSSSKCAGDSFCTQ